MLPDVLGYPLEKGKKILEDNGYHRINLTFTASVKDKFTDKIYNCKRIIRTEIIDDSTVELLICNV